MTNEEIDKWLRKAKRQKIQEPVTEMGQYVDECGWSKTGYAIWNKNGGCTCVPARKSAAIRTVNG
jgi:hypothetical protein